MARARQVPGLRAELRMEETVAEQGDNHPRLPLRLELSKNASYSLLAEETMKLQEALVFG